MHTSLAAAGILILPLRRWHCYSMPPHPTALSAHCTPAPPDSPNRLVTHTCLCRHYVYTVNTDHTIYSNTYVTKEQVT